MQDLGRYAQECQESSDDLGLTPVPDAVELVHRRYLFLI